MERRGRSCRQAYLDGRARHKGREMRANRIESLLLEEGMLGMMLMVVLDVVELDLHYVLMLIENDDAAVG